MKKSLILISAVLLIAGLFVACNSDLKSADGTASVNFGNGAKALSYTTTPAELPDVNTLYWWYKAEKSGDSGAAGTKTVWTRIKEGTGFATLNNFKIGSGWTFTIAGKATSEAKEAEGYADCVYYGTNSDVTLKRGVNTINISLTWVAPTSATVNFSNITVYEDEAYFAEGDYWNILEDEEIKESGVLEDYEDKISTATPIAASAGQEHTYVVKVFGSNNVEIATQSVTFYVYPGSSVTVTGDMGELNVSADVEFDPSVEIEGYDALLMHGTSYTLYKDLKDALDAASNGETITLLRDISKTGSGSLFTYLSTTEDRNAKLDLNGKIITGILNNTASCQVFRIGSLNANSGDYQHTASLEILDSKASNDGYGTGAIIAQPTSYSDSWDVAVSTISVERLGELIIQSGKILVEGGSIPVSPSAENPYAIDVLTNTGSQPAKLTVNNGYIASNMATGVGIRTFCNSSTGTVYLTINGGYIHGLSRAVMLQIPGNLSGTKKAGLNCVINGGRLHSDLRALDVLNFNSTDKTDSGFYITVNGGEFISDVGSPTYKLIPFSGNDILFISYGVDGPYTPINFTDNRI